MTTSSLPNEIDLTAPPDLVLSVDGGAPLDVRAFDVREAINELFSVDISCVSPDPEIDLDAIIGKAATFSVRHGSGGHDRLWTGIVNQFALAQVEEDGLSTYQLRIVPDLWLLSQRRTYRIYQQISDVDIALSILSRWGIAPETRLRGKYKKRRYRTQYGESDYAFASRMLEDAGVSFYFDTSSEGGGRLIFDDAPQSAEPRGAPLPYVASPQVKLHYDFVTQVTVSRAVRPGKYTQQDLDYRLPPDMALEASASSGLPVEQAIERHHYNPGAMLFDSAGGDTPSADDRGAQRTDLGEGAAQAQKRLDAKRGRARRVSFVTSALDVRPGQVLSFLNHAKRELAPDKTMLVVESRFTGSATGDFRHAAVAQFADVPFRPELRTPKPRTAGVESATVVGPQGEEIHTDEFGRVRVHFHWDREGSSDETSSLWIPVNQPWAGAGFGALNIPRIGQEVFVDFLGGDPDRPVVMGRVFTTTNPAPYKLPKFKDLQGIRSESTPKLPAGMARSGLLGGMTAGGGDGSGEPSPQSSPLGGGMPFSLDQISKILQSSRFFQALSPNGETHNWQGSEFAMHDEQGKEKVYLQAQKDYREVVKNSQAQVVGHAKADITGSDHIENIGNKDLFRVTSDRTGLVNGNQGVVVQSAVYRESQASQSYFTKATYDSGAKDTAIKSDEGLSSDAKNHQLTSSIETVLAVGTSSIIIRPDGISINADTLLIKPDSISINVIKGSESLADVLAKEKRRAEAAMAREALTQFRNEHLPSDYYNKQRFLSSQLQDYSSLSQQDKDNIALGDLDRRGISPPGKGSH
jgi:type VI secretion system VgrG family protein